MANTRELIRQTMQVISLMVKDTGVIVGYGDGKNMTYSSGDGKVTRSLTDPKNQTKSHIFVCSPGFVKSAIQSNPPLINLAHLKMVIVDEADELFNNKEV